MSVAWGPSLLEQVSLLRKTWWSLYLWATQHSSKWMDFILWKFWTPIALLLKDLGGVRSGVNGHECSAHEENTVTAKFTHESHIHTREWRIKQHTESACIAKGGRILGRGNGADGFDLFCNRFYAGLCNKMNMRIYPHFVQTKKGQAPIIRSVFQ